MKKHLVLSVLIALAVIDHPGILYAAVVEVSMVNFEFQPKTLSINAGDTVRWTNNASIQHTTTSGTGCTADEKWDSGLLPRNETFSFEFTTAGEYPYYCIPHCALGMTGTVIVNGSTTTIPSTTTTAAGSSTTTAPSTSSTTTTGRPSRGGIFSIPPDVLFSLGEWPIANKNYRNTRATFYSRICAGNISRLHPIWTFDIPAASTFGAAASNPLILWGMVYFQDLKSNVYALSLNSGELVWKKDYNIDNIGPNGPAAGWRKIFVAKGAEVVALDMEGSEVWSTKLTEKESEGIDIQLMAYGNLVYVSTVPGSSVTNFYTGGAAGIIYALDQETGSIVWSFNTIVSEDIWENPEVNSGGGAWYPPAIDIKTGIMYWGTGNPAPFPGTPEFPNGSSRLGLNLYTDSMLALDTMTGELIWYNQLKPHDLFDLDFQLSPILATTRIDDRRKEVVIGGGKLGKVYAFDRKNGEILWTTSVGEHQNDELAELPEGTTRVLPGIFGGIETPMALAGGVLYVPVLNVFTDFTPTSVDQTTIDISGGTGELVAITINDGEVLWEKQFGAPNFGGATVVNDLVFTATFDGKIYALDRKTGEELWNYQASGGINAWPAVAGNKIIFPVGLSQPPQLIAFGLGF